GGPRAPYGYDVEGQGPEARLVVDPEEAQWVRLAYQLSVQEGYSAREIAAHLTAMGAPLPARKMAQHAGGTSGVWSGEQVIRILRNSTYRGERHHNKRSERPLRSQRCPALVDGETWERAQQRIRDARIPRAREGQRFYPLRGLLVCGLCGLRYHGWPHSPGRYYYLCHGRKKTPKCRSPHLPAERWEAWLWEAALDRLQQVDGLLGALEDEERRASALWQERTAEREQVRARIEDKTAERERVLGLFRRGHISEAEAERELSTISAEQALLTTRWEALLAPPPPQAADVRRRLVEEVRLLLSGEEDPPPALRHQVLALLLERVVVHPSPGTDFQAEWRV
ncbi:MAG TPA: recombinase family protein, partial [Armatimonadota bacterium]|nr:recombinase family protein [Armatimonadota bacterium]